MTHGISLAGPARNASPRRGRLALSLQEALTAIVRLRSGRPLGTDAAAFRAHLRQAIAAAEHDARAAGYTVEDVRLASAAVVAFLDESVLESRQPMFTDWPKAPLYAELFGAPMAGQDVLFQDLQTVLGRADSEDLADLLEVYALCLLLGFHGRHAASAPERTAIVARVSDRIDSVRGADGALSTDWSPSEGGVSPPADRGGRSVMLGAIIAVALVVVLFAGFWVTLHSGLGAVRQAAAAGAQR